MRQSPEGRDKAARKERGLPHTARELHAQQDQEMAGREVLGRCHQVSPELPELVQD